MTRWPLLCFAFLAMIRPSSAECTEVLKIKLATLAPAGSAWDNLLEELQADWSRASNGRVELRIFPGGVAGDESVVVQKMGINNYQAALITCHGLSMIERSTRVLSIPRVLRTDAEFEQALDLMGPELEKRLEAKGYEVLFWAEGGWVRFFVPTPDATLTGVKKHRLFSWAGDSQGVDLWKRAGFNVVPLPNIELATSLQTKLIDAFDTVPYYAVATQAFRHVDYMIDMNWTPILGAFVITKATWDQIPEDLQPVLRQIAATYSLRFRAETQKMEEDAITAMKARGLQVITPDPKVVAEWDQSMEELYPEIRGFYVSAEDFDWMQEVARKVRNAPMDAVARP
jgi:TRAP-type transport system periplasmic protein